MATHETERSGNGTEAGLDCCQRLAPIFRALGNPTRLGILRRMLDEPPCVGELQEQLGCTQPNISQHLAVLRDRGIVVAERRGNRVCYRLADPRIAELLTLAEEIFAATPAPGSARDDEEEDV